MKKAKKITSILMAILMFVSSLSLGSFAFAEEGSGTETDPYQITTAQQLQNINNNVSAHYKLMADIDLSGREFTPIGNADSGAFSGSFDGNGYTISNLDVYGGKYAGLFGCNEGVIKSVTLSNIDVYGTQYVGGIVGQNTESGTLESCTVLKGNISSENLIGKLYTGGVCGYNAGKIDGTFKNNSDINIISNTGSAITGGIIGLNNVVCALTASNNGAIIANSDYREYDSTIGGIIGASGAYVLLQYCTNNGKLCTFGLYNNASCSIGGLIGHTDSCSVISSYNSGQIECNSGYSDTCGGIIGETSRSSTITIINSYNSGNIYTKRTANNCAITYYGEITNCYNIGNIAQTSNGGYWTSCPLGRNPINSYITYEQELISYSNPGVLPIGKQSDESSYNNWDFDEYWTIDKSKNSGFPMLKHNANELVLNESAKTIVVGKNLQLEAYKEGTKTNSVIWTVTAGNAAVTKNGLFTACGSGMATVTATDADGNKANFNVYMVEPVSSAGINSSYSVYQNNNISIYTNDIIVDLSCNDESIATVKQSTSKQIDIYGVNVGTTTVSYKTLQGFSGTFTVTVNRPAANDIQLYSANINKGSSVDISSKISYYYGGREYPSSSVITSWKSDNESIATVDNNGKVTGVGVGTAHITATTDNGLSASCEVHVLAPVETMSFEEPSITMYNGDTYKTKLSINPTDTTDTISYSSSGAYSIDANGLITAKSIGTYTITATASNGVTAYCTVKIVDTPVIVTDLTLSASELQMLEGEVSKLTETVTPSNATNKTVTWSTSDEAVATVSESGLVTAVGEGAVVITAETANGIVKQCLVYVTTPVCKHENQKWVTMEEPTFEKAGYAVLICNDCGYISEKKTLPKLTSENAYVYLDDVELKVGETVKIPVMINANPGFAGFHFELRTNNEYLEIVGVEKGSLLDNADGTFVTPNIENDSCALTYAGKNTITGDGSIAVIEVKALKKTDEEALTLSLAALKKDIFIDEDNNNIEVTLLSATANITDNTRGDVNGDGSVDMIDCRLILQYLALYDVTLDAEAADINDDGDVTIIDARMLMQIISEYDI